MLDGLVPGLGFRVSARVRVGVRVSVDAADDAVSPIRGQSGEV